MHAKLAGPVGHVSILVAHHNRVSRRSHSGLDINTSTSHKPEQPDAQLAAEARARSGTTHASLCGSTNSDKIEH